MFKFIKSLFSRSKKEVDVSSQEVDVEVEEHDQEVPEQQEKNQVDLIIEAYEELQMKHRELQRKIMLDVMVELYETKYTERFTKDDINGIWKDLFDRTPKLLSERIGSNPKAKLRDICIEICEEEFNEADKFMEEQVRKSAIDKVMKHLSKALDTVEGYKNIAKFSSKVMVAIDDLTAGMELQPINPKMESCNSSSDQEFFNAIDSFVDACSKLNPNDFVEQEVDLIPEEEVTEPEVFLTDDEKRFIELFEQYPDCSPIVIFNMIHKEKQSNTAKPKQGKKQKH